MDMTPDVIVQAIRLAAEDGYPFHLQLTGGEPTLVPMLIRKAAEVAETSGHCQSIGIQTNGTLLSPDIIGMLKKYHFQVGVSLDGSPGIHAYSRGRADKKTGMNAANHEDLILGVQKLGETLDAVNARRQTPLQWRERELLRTKNRRYDSAFCHASRAQCVAVAPDGRIFPCGQTLEDPQFAAGTVWAPEPERLDILTRVRVQTAMCADCQVQPICPGDCPSRLYYNQNTNPALICHIYKTLHSMMMASGAHA